MPFIGNKPSAVPLTSADIADGIITSAKIADGTIVNTDINATAGVVFTKLASTGTITLHNIQFPATAVLSANANNLDDYEEGTWDPRIGGNAIYNSAVGIYTKIGNQVTVAFNLAINTLGTGSTDTVSGLPFTSQNIAIYNVNGNAVSYHTTLAVNVVSISAIVDRNSTNVKFATLAAAGATMVYPVAVLQNSTDIYATITYMIG